MFRAKHIRRSSLLELNAVVLMGWDLIALWDGTGSCYNLCCLWLVLTLRKTQAIRDLSSV